MCHCCDENEGRPIAVVDCATGRIVYEGIDEEIAAELLNPGTVFARDRSARFALFLARRAAAVAWVRDKNYSRRA